MKPPKIFAGEVNRKGIALTEHRSTKTGERVFMIASGTSQQPATSWTVRARSTHLVELKTQGETTFTLGQVTGKKPPGCKALPM
jgi:hypothetical protein